MTVQAQTNQPYANRVQLQFSGITVPMASSSRPFDPTQDLELYIDGILTPVQYFGVDLSLNRYQLFTARPFDPQACVQVVFHMPISPFLDSNSTVLSGFAVIAAYSATSGDTPNAPSGVVVQDVTTGEFYLLYVSQASFNLIPTTASAAELVLIKDPVSDICYQVKVDQGSLIQAPVAYTSAAVVSYPLVDIVTGVTHTLTISNGALVEN